MTQTSRRSLCKSKFDCQVLVGGQIHVSLQGNSVRLSLTKHQLRLLHFRLQVTLSVSESDRHEPLPVFFWSACSVYVNRYVACTQVCR